MRERRERAYLTKEICGHFCFDPIIRWNARDYWGNWIASGKTRKECETECRYKGYVPERG